MKPSRIAVAIGIGAGVFANIANEPIAIIAGAAFGGLVGFGAWKLYLNLSGAKPD